MILNAYPCTPTLPWLCQRLWLRRCWPSVDNVGRKGLKLPFCKLCCLMYRGVLETARSNPVSVSTRSPFADAGLVMVRSDPSVHFPSLRLRSWTAYPYLSSYLESTFWPILLHAWYGSWHNTVVCLSVCPPTTLCIVAFRVGTGGWKLYTVDVFLRRRFLFTSSVPICWHFPNMTLTCLTVTLLLACYTNIVIEFLLSSSFISSWTIYIIAFLAFWQVFPLNEHGVVWYCCLSSCLIACNAVHCGAQDLCRGLKVVPSCSCMRRRFLFTPTQTFAVRCIV